MGRLGRYNKLVQGISPHYVNLNVFPRGFPVFPDPLLKGQVRFARKTGADFALINPDNEVLLAEDAPRNTQVFILERSNRWLEHDAILSVGPDIELARVRDFSENRIILQSPILSDVITTENTVNLFATPIFAGASASTGTTTLFVRSRYHLMAGDRIAIEIVPDLLTSLFEIRIAKARLLSVIESMAPFAFFIELELDEPLPIALDSEDRLYLKAQPSYVSNHVFVPNIPGTADTVGPFILDYISGVLFDRPEVEETLSIEFFDKLRNPVGAGDFPEVINKQFSVPNVAVSSDSMLFWSVVYGSVTFEKRSSTQEILFGALLDEEGRFQIVEDMVPNLPPGTEWRVPVIADSNVELFIDFEPNAERSFTVPANVSTNVLVGTKAFEKPVSRISFALKGPPGAKVVFGNWINSANGTFSFIYRLTANVFGDGQWQASSLFAKPYFLSTGMGLKGRFDSDRTPKRLDGGILFT